VQCLGCAVLAGRGRVAVRRGLTPLPVAGDFDELLAEQLVLLGPASQRLDGRRLPCHPQVRLTGSPPSSLDGLDQARFPLALGPVQPRDVHVGIGFQVLAMCGFGNLYHHGGG
jgi:hypothetical protein